MTPNYLLQKMKDEQKVYIKGNAERGDEVIKLLIDLGGKNINNLNGEDNSVYYYIDPKEKIDIVYNYDKNKILSFIKEFYKEIKLSRWNPEYKSLYFYIDTRGQIMSDLWYNMETDKLRYKFGNCFIEYEEAKIARDKIQEILNDGK